MLFDLFTRNDINKGVAEWKQTADAVLLDVRTVEEFQNGHIPQSINIDVDEIYKATNLLKDKSVPLFVHCLSGARSACAVNALKEMGYTNVKNIGGISDYIGETVKGV